MYGKKRTRGGISKNIETARNWGKNNGRRKLWLDDEGKWHAAVDERSVPHYAKDVQDVWPTQTAKVHHIPEGTTAKMRLLDGPVEHIECGAVIAIEENEMLTHTIRQENVPDRVYKGFTRDNQNKPAAVLAIALFDGDSDLYAVDPDHIPLAKEEIIRMYEDDYSRGPSNLTFYRRIEGLDSLKAGATIAEAADARLGKAR